jgi:carboxypeptidase PM20D1
MRKRFFRVLLILLAVLIVILLINTFRFSSVQKEVQPAAKIQVSDSAVNHLSESVRFATNSYQEANRMDTAAFKGFARFLARTYPKVHASMQRELVNEHGLLYKWQGKRNDLAPIILMAHYDVVPVEAAAEKEWTQKPYSGIVKDGYIWGRGTMDDKVSVLGLMESAEMLLNEGYTPERTIYFAFGQDEEIGGEQGAKAIAALLKSRNIKAEMVLDEGHIIGKGLVPGIEKDVAMIGTSEKGFMSVELSIASEGGHSSMPPKETSIELLARAVVKLREEQPDKHFSAPIEDFFASVGPEMPFFQKLVIGNRWLFTGVLLNMYSKTNSGNALVRTTTAPTIFSSGVKDNVLPTTAKAMLNFRILPGESTQSVLQHIKDVVADERITIKPMPFMSEPSPVSPVNVPAYNAIETTIRQTFPSALVAPNLVIGATDSRYYTAVSDNVYRFLPLVTDSEDLKRLHGIDERISVEAWKDCIRFYYQLMKNCSGDMR